MLYRLMIVVLLLSAPSMAQDKTVYLATLEWPPYTGKALNHEGASVAVARSMFEAMGYKLKVDFLSWSEAVKQGSDPDSKYMGFFPVYQSKVRDHQCHYSEPIGFSPLGFAQLKSYEVPLTTMDDLSKVAPIGVVKEYFNSEEFDARAKLQEILTLESGTDKANLQRLASNEVALSVIDRHVMEFLLDTDEDLKKYRSMMSFNEMLLDEKRLFICFKKTKESVGILSIFNQGVDRINMRKFFKESLR